MSAFLSLREFLWLSLFVGIPLMLVLSVSAPRKGGQK